MKLARRRAARIAPQITTAARSRECLHAIEPADAATIPGLLNAGETSSCIGLPTLTKRVHGVDVEAPPPQRTQSVVRAAAAHTHRPSSQIHLLSTV